MNPNIIIKGDALAELRKLPDGCVDCVITSPPYWGLRDYGVEGQLGLEKTPEQFVQNMVEVFREVRRTLTPVGTLWLNIGDSYAGSWGNYGGKNRGAGNQRIIRNGSTVPNPAYDGHEQWRPPTSGKFGKGIKPKDLVGIPWMLAFALRADGWYLRQDIIWHKPNPMPESVQDRCTKAHEYVFMFSKSARYYYDAYEIKTQTLDPDRERATQVTGWGNSEAYHGSNPTDDRHLKDLPGSGRKLGEFRDKQRGHSRRHAGFNDRWDEMPKAQQQALANKRSVWSVATMPFKEAHFATFPEKLIEPMILAGCPQHVCNKCRKPRERIVDRKFVPQADVSAEHNTGHGKIDASSGWSDTPRGTTATRQRGWSDCGCGEGFGGGGGVRPIHGRGHHRARRQETRSSLSRYRTQPRIYQDGREAPAQYPRPSLLI